LPEETAVPDQSVFTTVLRGWSGAVIWPEEALEIQLADIDTAVVVRTRWISFGLEHPEPGDMWVEVRGPAASLDDAEQKHAIIARVNRTGITGGSVPWK
jgi:hypothetical protein